jgi:hypothetical protein
MKPHCPKFSSSVGLTKLHSSVSSNLLEDEQTNSAVEINIPDHAVRKSELDQENEKYSYNYLYIHY